MAPTNALSTRALRAASGRFRSAAARQPDAGVDNSSAGTLLNLIDALGLNQQEAAAKHELFNMVYDQTGEAFAAFQQFEWHFTQQWPLLGGLRISKEIKRGMWNDFFETGGGTAAANRVATALGLASFSDVRELSETQLQPKVS